LKIIAKILSKRLKQVLKLVGETQTTFVTGRQILDGALIGNEVVDWLKKSRKKGALLKLDFQKAYDTIDWHLLDQVMQMMGFGEKWRRWIQECITKATILVVVNGKPTKPFRTRRGLRQGEPLSPLLFVLIAEVLNKMFQRAASNGLIRGIEVGRDKIPFTHLQFADDTSFSVK